MALYMKFRASRSSTGTKAEEGAEEGTAEGAGERAEETEQETRQNRVNDTVR